METLKPYLVAILSAMAGVFATKLWEWYTAYRNSRINKCPYFKELHHVSLSVDNLDEARAFYTDILKLTQIQRPGVFPFPGAWFALPGGKQLHLVENLIDAERTCVVLKTVNNERIAVKNKFKKIFEESAKLIIINSHFAIRVKKRKDYDEIKIRAQERGLEISDKNFQGMEQLYMMDPCKNMIEISYFEDNGFMSSKKLQL